MILYVQVQIAFWDCTKCCVCILTIFRCLA